MFTAEIRKLLKTKKSQIRFTAYECTQNDGSFSSQNAVSKPPTNDFYLPRARKRSSPTHVLMRERAGKATLHS